MLDRLSVYLGAILAVAVFAVRLNINIRLGMNVFDGWSIAFFNALLWAVGSFWVGGVFVWGLGCSVIKYAPQLQKILGKTPDSLISVSGEREKTEADIVDSDGKVITMIDDSSNELTKKYGVEKMAKIISNLLREGK